MCMGLFVAGFSSTLFSSTLFLAKPESVSLLSGWRRCSLDQPMKLLIKCEHHWAGSPCRCSTTSCKCSGHTTSVCGSRSNFVRPYDWCALKKELNAFVNHHPRMPGLIAADYISTSSSLPPTQSSFNVSQWNHPQGVWLASGHVG